MRLGVSWCEICGEEAELTLAAHLGGIGVCPSCLSENPDPSITDYSAQAQEQAQAQAQAGNQPSDAYHHVETARRLTTFPDSAQAPVYLCTEGLFFVSPYSWQNRIQSWTVRFLPKDGTRLDLQAVGSFDTEELARKAAQETPGVSMKPAVKRANPYGGTPMFSDNW